MEYLNSSLFFSVLYHDIFDYPLNSAELKRWQVSTVRNGRFLVEKTAGFYHLPKRKDIVFKRLSLLEDNESKLEIASVVAGKIALIPTVEAIFVSGSLAMKNARPDDDIDLVIICDKNTLWITRFLAIVLLDLLGIPRRRPKDKMLKNKICLNLWLDEKNLKIPKISRNIYTAHEVLQVIPLIDKKGIYDKFIKTNNWAGRYWPKAGKELKIESFKKVKSTGNLSGRKRSRFVNLIFYILINILNVSAYIFQRLYMKRHMTFEKVEIGSAFFHPFDWNRYVLSALRNRVEENTAGFANARSCKSLERQFI